MNYRASVLLSLFLAFVTAAQTIKTVTRDGRYLYTDAGATRFFIKGVAYQPQGEVLTTENNPFLEPTTFVDPLADASGCQRDLPFLKQLTVNVIRVYSVNSSLNHDECMNILSEAGIYTIIDLSIPLNGSINTASPSWSTNLLNQYIATIDAFSKYNNVLAYNVGNEIITALNVTYVAPYIKAAARDTRSYLLSKNITALVGYAAIDGDAKFLLDLAEYLSCAASGDKDGSTAIDLFGLNDYEWCGDSSYAQAYEHTVTAFAQYNVAAYFSEFGCITSPPRLWTEVVALFGSFMIQWSGGIAFSYFPAQSAQGQFGIVTISADGSSVTTSSDFDLLKEEYSNVTFLNSPSQSAAGTPTYPSCPAVDSEFLASSTLPPTPNNNACNCLENNLSCQFTPATNNYTAIVGELLDTGCSLLGMRGGTCNDISSNGTTGVYGLVSSCGPTIALSYVMSLYYGTDRNPQSCSFAGNGTVNPSSTVSASAVASSCFANNAAVFTPSAPATSTSTPKSTSKNGSGASFSLNLDAIVGMSVMAIVAVTSAVWTLA